jgi:hypothetical protein
MYEAGPFRVSVGYMKAINDGLLKGFNNIILD